MQPLCDDKGGGYFGIRRRISNKHKILIITCILFLLMVSSGLSNTTGSTVIIDLFLANIVYL
jgi:hypothetical protein